MDHQTPDPDHGQSPSNGARIEGDLVRPLKRIAGSSRLRLPAALPFAIAGILVVSSVAFGAAFVRSIVNPSPSATPVLVGDDDPTDSPSIAPSEAPSLVPTEAPPAAPSEAAPIAPSAGDLALTAVAAPGKVTLTWTRYSGTDFGYYKVVRSTDATAAWPLGAGDTLVAAVDNIDTLTFTDSCGAGTFTYEVFAVKSSDAGYALLASSNVKTITVSPASSATKTPAPATNPADLGALSVKDTATAPLRSAGPPTRAPPSSYWAVPPVGASSSDPIAIGHGDYAVRIQAIGYPGGSAHAYAQTTVLRLTISAPAPTPTPTPTATSTPTPTPVP